MLLKDLHLPLINPPFIRCDNLGAMAIASNPIYHVQTKHIEVDHHFICEKVLNNDITFNFISTCDQPTAIFTKGLTSTRFLLLRDKLMVCTPPIYLRVAVNLSPPVDKIAAHQGATFLPEQDNTKYAKVHGHHPMIVVMSSYNKGGSTNIKSYYIGRQPYKEMIHCTPSSSKDNLVIEGK
jgi:hypothetical protein